MTRAISPVFTALLFSFLLLPEAIGDDALAQAVLTAHSAHCDKVRGIEFKLKRQRARNGQTLETDDYVCRYESRANVPGHLNRFYGEMNTKLAALPGATRQEIEAFDGSLLRTLRSSSDAQAHVSLAGKIEQQAGIRLDDAWLRSFYAVANWSYDELYRYAEVSGPIEWNGRQVYSVFTYYGPSKAKDKKRNFRFYLDIAHDYAKCYGELFNDAGDRITTEEVTEFVSVDGVWLPSATRLWGMFADGPLDETCRFEYVRLNPQFTAEDFAVDFPAGTYVTDSVAGVAYRLDAGMTGLESERRATKMDALMEKASAEATSVPTATSISTSPQSRTDNGVASPGRRPWVSILLLIIAASFCLAVLFSIWWRRRRPKE